MSRTPVRSRSAKEVGCSTTYSDPELLYEIPPCYPAKHPVSTAKARRKLSLSMPESAVKRLEEKEGNVSSRATVQGRRVGSYRS